MVPVPDALTLCSTCEATFADSFLVDDEADVNHGKRQRVDVPDCLPNYDNNGARNKQMVNNNSKQLCEGKQQQATILNTFHYAAPPRSQSSTVSTTAERVALQSQCTYKLMCGGHFFAKKYKAGSDSQPQKAAFAFLEAMKKDNTLKDPIVVKWLYCRSFQKPPIYFTHWFGVIELFFLYELVSTGLVTGVSKKPVHIRNVTFQEVIMQNKDCRLLFDIDKKTQVQPTLLDAKGLLQSLHDSVISASNRLQLSLPLDRLVVCNIRMIETGSTYQNWLLSLHVYYYNVVFIDNNLEMKKFVSWLLYLTPSLQIDDKIYTRNRCFRLLGCRKDCKLFDYDSKLQMLQQQVDGSWIVAPTFTFKDFARATGTQIVEGYAEVTRVPMIPPPPSAVVQQFAQVSTRTVRQKPHITQLSDEERKWCYSEMLQQYVNRRATNKHTGRDDEFPPFSQTTHGERSPVVFLTVTVDRFCDVKGAEHDSDHDGTRTSYVVNYMKQTFYIRCFSCENGPDLSLCTPDEKEDDFPTFYHSLAAKKNEVVTAKIFYREHSDQIYSVPMERDKCDLYAWNKATNLWDKKSHQVLRRLFATWVLRKEQQMCNYFTRLSEGDYKMIEKWAREFCSKVKFEHVLSFVKSIAVDPEFGDRLNKQSHLVPLNDNNVVDLRNGKSRVRTPEDMFSMCMNFRMLDDLYDPEIREIEDWISELGRHNIQWYNYLHAMCGYFISGEVFDRSFVICKGIGANGKSTLFACLKNIMAGFFVTATRSMFCQRASDRESANSASPNMHHLDGARMILVSETAPGFRINWDLIKAISSGEHLLVRALYAEPKEIEMHAKVVFGTNHLPEIDASDQAVVDRFRLLNFEARYVSTVVNDNEIIKDPVKEMRLRSLLDAFGTWCVTGARLAYRESPPHVPTPVLVQLAIDSAIEESDVVAAFLNEEGEIGNDFKWLQHDMFLSFIKWAGNRGSPKADIVSTVFFEEIVNRFGHKGIRPYTVPGQRPAFTGIQARPFAQIQSVDEE
jgi:P4 family phage/plasmid primase-like protien